MAAGEYSTRFTWLRRTQGPADSFGQKHDLFPVMGTLWGALEGADSSRQTRLESDRQEDTATVRVRNSPAILPGDILRECGSGTEWTVLTTTGGANELVCEVEG